MPNPAAFGGDGGDVLGKEPAPFSPNAPHPQTDRDPPERSDAVGMFAPWAGPSERALRLRIHKARDIAVARAMRSHDAARALYWTAGQIASERVFARMPEAALTDTLEALASIFRACDRLERSEPQ